MLRIPAGRTLLSLSFSAKRLLEKFWVNKVKLLWKWDTFWAIIWGNITTHHVLQCKLVRNETCKCDVWHTLQPTTESSARLRHSKTRKPCCRKETARCRMLSFSISKIQALHHFDIYFESTFTFTPKSSFPHNIPPGNSGYDTIRYDRGD